MARASDGPASSADLGWRSKDLTEITEHTTLDTGAGKDFVPTALVHELFGHWAQRYIVLLGKWRCVGGSLSGLPFGRNWKGATENLGSYSKKKLHVGFANKQKFKPFVLWKCEALARRPINPPTVSFLFTIIHISSSAGAWAFLLLALFGEGAQDWKMQLTLVLSLLWVLRIKAKAWGVIGKQQKTLHTRGNSCVCWIFLQTNHLPTAARTHHRIRSPSIKCSGT